MEDLLKIKAFVPNIDPMDLLPFLALLVGAIACLIADAFTDKEGGRRALPIVAGLSILGSMAGFFASSMPTLPFAEGTFKADEFGQLGSLVILFAGLVTTLLAPRLIEKRNLPAGEFYALTLFALFGMVLLTIANELLTAFICIELFSLSLYVLTGIDRRSARSTEGAFKYFILGSFASAFLVLGIAFLYGATHTTNLHEIGQIVAKGGITHNFVQGTGGLAQETLVPLNPIYVYTGFALVFVGICFKLSLAPFHMYAPDVYEGANTPTTMIIATASKVAALALLVHVVEALSLWPAFGRGASFIIGFAAITSMIWGNLAALVQTNIKRMLAFSSVAHTGYVSVGVLVLAVLPSTGLVGDDLGVAQSHIRNAMLLYMGGYTLMNVLAFGIANNLGGEGHMNAYRGLVHRNPMAALGMAVAMFSLLGIPPTVGFMGKIYVFREAVQYGYAGVAVIGVLASVISAFYYLSLVVTMFMREEAAEEGAPALAGGLDGIAVAAGGLVLPRAALVLSAALVIAFGLVPGAFFALNYTLALF